MVPYSGLPYNLGCTTNVFGLRGRYSPGGQRLLLTLTQEVGYDGSDDVAEGPKLSDFNLLTFTFSARVAWKFLPKTALFLELTQGAMRYLSDAARLQHRADSFPLRLGGGLLGLLTPKIAVNLFAGYGYGFYLQGPSPSTAVVQAEVRIKPTFFSCATLVVGLGYGFTTNQSNGTTILRDATTQITFLKHEAWLRLTAHY